MKILFIGFLIGGVSIWAILLYADWYIQREIEKAEKWMNELREASLKDMQETYEKSLEAVKKMKGEG